MGAVFEAKLFFFMALRAYKKRVNHTTDKSTIQTTSAGYTLQVKRATLSGCTGESPTQRERNRLCARFNASRHPSGMLANPDKHDANEGAECALVPVGSNVRCSPSYYSYIYAFEANESSRAQVRK